MAEDNRHIMAYILCWGLYEYNLLPLGLMNALETFQRLMNIFHGFFDKFLGIYLDDLLVYRKSLENHMCPLRLFLD